MPHWLKPLLIATVSALVLIGSIAVLETVLRAGFASGGDPRSARLASAAPVPSGHGLLPGRREPARIPRRPDRTAESAANVPQSSRSAGRPRSGSAHPRYEDTYPFKLQALLRQRYPDVTIEAQNAGNAWYTTAHLLIEYQLLVRQFEPDLIVVFEAINDLYRSFSPPWWAVGEFRPDYSHYSGSVHPLPGSRRGAWAHPLPGGPSRICWSGGGSGKTCSASRHPYRFDAGNLQEGCAPACAHER